MAETITAEATATETIASDESTQVPEILGESYAFWFQTAVLMIAAIIAFWSICISRAIERRKAAAAVIFASRQDGQLIDSIRKIATLHKSQTKMEVWASDANVTTPDDVPPPLSSSSV